MLNFTTDQWVIIGLVFVLGLLVGMWATSGGRRKWKSRYNEEVTQRKALDTRLKERETHWTTQEKEWRERDARREEELRSRPVAAPVATPVRDDYVEPRRDLDRDGVPDDYDRRPLDGDRR
ncbi:hypothetical protein [Sphingomonas astaxanthinifaciens]|uniref:LapA family protein n=1 Tax=Sphingomonas astaxanthinifaciens DSM 22298 TaxID=1123267 RepID=A0ABQ5Z916_9SPHN|nr:hypothetical protein [Sphingomonas astaxanthinifaciens]GLR48486.1 hypothetical protein GCM10007925_22030 [Sphingomonas astaxanthinifaciens DSM 22298]